MVLYKTVKMDRKVKHRHWVYFSCNSILYSVILFKRLDGNMYYSHTAMRLYNHNNADSSPQVRCRLRAAGWWKVPDGGSTGPCWSGPAVRAWSPGSNTLWREVAWSGRKGRPGERWSTGARGPNTSTARHNLTTKPLTKMSRIDDYMDIPFLWYAATLCIMC